MLTAPDKTDQQEQIAHTRPPNVGTVTPMIERVARAIAACLGDDRNVMPQDIEMARAAIAAMREPTVDQVAAAFPCERDMEFSHEDKCLGAAVCLKLGGAADVGIFEGEAVKQAAFLARDYRIMIAAALKPEVQP